MSRLPVRDGLEVAGDGEERVRETGAARGRDPALRVAQHDRHAVRAEQDACVIGQVADDIADVEPGGEVGGDASQGLAATGRLVACSVALARG